MKKNMGTTDKAIRIAIAILVGVLYFNNTISGTAALILGAIALIFVLTSLISFCPLYAIFGLSSCKIKK